AARPAPRRPAAERHDPDPRGCRPGTQQARNASMAMAEWGLAARFLLLDYDAKFTDGFDAVFAAEGTEFKRVGPVAPNLNGYAERWVQSLRTECLDHFVVLGEGHLRHRVREYVEHHNLDRPHQGRGNVALPRAVETAGCGGRPGTASLSAGPPGAGWGAGCAGAGEGGAPPAGPPELRSLGDGAGSLTLGVAVAHAPGPVQPPRTPPPRHPEP